jgi:hypothetical protein
LFADYLLAVAGVERVFHCLAHCLMNEYKFSGKLAAALIDPDHQSRAEH